MESSVNIASTSHAMHTLPSDILLEIFFVCRRWCQEFSSVGIGSLDATRGPWVLARVCRRWRQVALSTPSLWADVYICSGPWRGITQRDLSVLGIQLARSGNALLDVSVDLVNASAYSVIEYGGIVHTAIQMIAKECRRWQNVILSLLRSSMKYFSLVRGNLPFLRHLDISVHCYAFPDRGELSLEPELDIFNHAPSLRSLSYRACGDSRPISFPILCLSQLHTLELCGSSFLRTFKDGSELVLPVLVVLKFSELYPALLRKLVAPKLTSLTYYHMVYPDPTRRELSTQYLADSIIDFFERSLFPLRLLDVVCTGELRDLRRVFGRIPTITNLHIQHVPSQSEEDDIILFLEGLTLTLSLSDPLLLPGLSRFTFESRTSSKRPWLKTALTMIRSRLTGSTTTGALDSVLITFGWGLDDWADLKTLERLYLEKNAQDHLGPGMRDIDSEIEYVSQLLREGNRIPYAFPQPSQSTPSASSSLPGLRDIDSEIEYLSQLLREGNRIPVMMPTPSQPMFPNV